MTTGQAASSLGTDAGATHATMECPTCAETISTRAKKCRFCQEILYDDYPSLETRRGTVQHVIVNNTVTPSAYNRPPKSRLAAILIALFLGGIGIHKFYLGRPGFGILYLLFCWTFIPTLIAFIEAIIYIFTSEEAFHHKYG